MTPTGERIERSYLLHIYSPKKWLESVLRESGFEEVAAFGAAFGAWDDVTPIAPDL